VGLDAAHPRAHNLAQIETSPTRKGLISAMSSTPKMRLPLLAAPAAEVPALLPPPPGPGGEELRVGDVARLAGKTVRALHLYEELGILEPTLRSKGGFRLYNHDAVRRVPAASTRARGQQRHHPLRSAGGRGDDPLPQPRHDAFWQRSRPAATTSTAGKPKRPSSSPASRSRRSSAPHRQGDRLHLGCDGVQQPRDQGRRPLQREEGQAHHHRGQPSTRRCSTLATRSSATASRSPTSTSDSDGRMISTCRRGHPPRHPPGQRDVRQQRDRHGPARRRDRRAVQREGCALPLRRRAGPRPMCR
jgi:hypothetical protein